MRALPLRSPLWSAAAVLLGADLVYRLVLRDWAASAALALAGVPAAFLALRARAATARLLASAGAPRAAEPRAEAPRDWRPFFLALAVVSAALVIVLT